MDEVETTGHSGDRRRSPQERRKRDTPAGPVNRYVGIDLASQPGDTGVVVLVVKGDRARASLPGEPGEKFVADDANLAAIVDTHTAVGLDAPLGWPDDFVAAVASHRTSARWPSYEHRSSDKIRQTLCYRTTDLYVQQHLSMTPLSVSSDRIGVVAMRAARLQSLWVRRWGDAEERDGSGRLVETYPAAALSVWGLRQPHGIPYKGGRASERESRRDARREILAKIIDETKAWLEIDDDVRVGAVNSDHVFDALICALVVLAARADMTCAVPEDARDAARREGWIHYPNDRESLAQLGAALPSS
ncbi:MAG: DUF429 domain-containing protein [Acidimicrobiales bacterium]